MFDLLERPDVTNPVILTGDIHAAIAGDVHRGADPAMPRLATELVTTSISSTFTQASAQFDAALRASPLVHHVNSAARGYLVCDVTPERWEASFRVVSTTLEPTATRSTDAVVTIPAT
jgi:alkaline phosphatase D